jgi:hypothetical protein
MNRHKLHPFNHFYADGSHYCPKCGSGISENKIRRTICHGKLHLWGPRCPEAEHFHRSCVYCNGEWCEATLEANKSEILEMLDHAFDMCDRALMEESDIVNHYKLRTIKSVMD